MDAEKPEKISKLNKVVKRHGQSLAQNGAQLVTKRYKDYDRIDFV